jgi:hypothetical protein
VDNPKEGKWRVVIRTRKQVKNGGVYDLRDALLSADVPTVQSADEEHQSGETWLATLPPKRSDAQYVAFRIAGAPGNVETTNDAVRSGLRIAMTSLDTDAP